MQPFVASALSQAPSQAIQASEAPSQALQASQGDGSSASAHVDSPPSQAHSQAIHASQDYGASASAEVDQPGSVHQGCTDRKKRDLALAMVCHFNQVTHTLDSNMKSEVLLKFFSHPKMDVVVKNTRFPTKDISDLIVDNLKRSLNCVKGVHSKDELAAKRAALHMLVNTSNDVPISASKLAKALDIQPRNLKKHRVDIHATDFKWASGDRKRRTDSLSPSIVQCVTHYWESNTRVSPNKKDICRKRLGRKQYDIHPTHFLELTEAEFFLNFKEQHPSCVIGFRAFQQLKPFFVKRLKERNTCCCVYHARMDLLRLAVNSMRSNVKDLHGPTCNCECQVCRPMGETVCIGNTQIYPSVTQLWTSAVCPKEEDAEWHKLQCMLGTCGACPKPRFCPQELNNVGSAVRRQAYEYVKEKTKFGVEKKRIKLIYKETTPLEVIDAFKMHLKIFIAHNFRSYWQHTQFKECISNFPDDVVLSVVDFAENYTFKVQNEIQSMHWHNDQCTIMVHICYWRDNNEMKKQAIFYISDDRNHDTLFVQHCFLQHHQWLSAQGLAFKRHWVWSDGAASQFKAARPFYFVGRYYSLTGLRMCWNFFGSGHGKGEHDGAGAVIKRALTAEQLDVNGAKLQNAHDVVEWLTWKMGDDGKVQRRFVEVKVGDVDRSNSYACGTIKGTRKTHCILGFSKKDPTQVLFRSLSCFCSFCMEDKWDQCTSIKHAGPWSLKKLEPTRAPEDDPLMEDEVLYSDRTDTLADMLEVGDNFAVVSAQTNEDNQEYYIALCKEPKVVLTQQLTDGWGNVFNPGDEVIQGMYYQKLPSSRISYVLLKDAPAAIVHADAVVAIKFNMARAKHKVKGHKILYRVPPEVHERIMDNLAF